jgi:hypothetical protein
LDSLDKQTTYLTQGDLRVVKRREGKVKFKSERDPLELVIKVNQVDKLGRLPLAPDERKFRTLQRKCFDSKNQGLLGLIKTSEKLQNQRARILTDVNKLFDRSLLDRPFVLKEKL